MVGPDDNRGKVAVQMSRIYAGIAAAILLVIGVMHLIWAFSPWPLATWTDFARVVLGAPDSKVPAILPPMSIGVGIALCAAAYLTLARVGVVPTIGPAWVDRVGVWVVAVVMLGRATVAGFLPSTLHLAGTPDVYVRWDLMLYSPLCLVLGLLAVKVALSPGRA
jgi:hypothetical protein